jgi:signal transduction histidine kinase
VKSVNRILELVRRYGVDFASVAFAVAAQIELVFTKVDGPRWEVTILTLGFPLPLLYRKRFPIAAPLAVYAAAVMYSIIAPEAFNDVFVPFIAVLFNSWLLGSGSGTVGRKAFIGLAGVVVFAASISVRLQDSWIGNFFFIMLVFGGAWLAGLLVGQRGLQTRELRERAERAESERERRAEEAVGEERARIARELHDVVAHSVSVMVVQAAGVRRLLRGDQEREREALLVVERVGREALTEMRRMLGVIRAEGQGAARAPQPSLEHLDRLIERAREAGLDVDVKVEGQPRPLPAGIDLSAYRILQEGLTNTLKHSDRAAAHVLVRYGEGEIELEVVDESPAAASVNDGGFGLAGMRERVAVYGGEFEAGPRPEGGFRVRAKLPLVGAA